MKHKHQVLSQTVFHIFSYISNVTQADANNKHVSKVLNNEVGVCASNPSKQRLRLHNTALNTRFKFIFSPVCFVAVRGDDGCL